MAKRPSGRLPGLGYPALTSQPTEGNPTVTTMSFIQSLLLALSSAACSTALLSYGEPGPVTYAVGAATAMNAIIALLIALSAIIEEY